MVSHGRRALRRCLALLAANGPLSGKELARRLVGTDGRISRRVVNSVLSLEGAAAVSYDRDAYTYRQRARDTGPQDWRKAATHDVSRRRAGGAGGVRTPDDGGRDRGRGPAAGPARLGGQDAS